MNTQNNHTPRITVISTNHVLVTNAHGTYPIHVHWLDIEHAEVRARRAVSIQQATRIAARREGERAA